VTRLVEIREYATAADAMWERIGDFHGLDRWLGVVTSSESIDGGRRRRLTVTSGDTVIEGLVESGERYYTYTIEESLLPLSGYVSTLCVRPGSDDASCVVEWTADFEPIGVSEAEASEIVVRNIRSGLDAI
jgi:hypothetical protein